MANLSGNQNIFAGNWHNNIIDVIKIGKDGSVNQFWCGGGGQQWGQNNFAKPGTASTEAGITAVSRMPGTWECWWIGKDGSVQGMYWYAVNSGVQFYQLAPAGSASVTGGIKSLSRASTHMEVWWIAPDGAIRGRYFYGQWNTDNLLVTYAPPGSASKDGTITGLVLNNGTAMELLYTGPQGQINGVYWFESENKWHPTEYVSAAKAAIAPTGCVTMYVNTNQERKVYWIDKLGKIKKLWFNTQKWVLIDNPIAIGANPNGCISAVSAIPTSSDIWFTANDGTMKGAFSRLNSPNYTTHSLPNSSNSGICIFGTSRTKDCLEVYWLDNNDNIQTANYYTSVGVWQGNALGTFKPKVPLATKFKGVWTNFDPQIHGFHFNNTFQAQLFEIPIPIPPFKASITVDGLCSGMVYAALDYFNLGKPIPQEFVTPPDHTPLPDYFFGRWGDASFSRGVFQMGVK
jgi:hypothetical protein